MFIEKHPRQDGISCAFIGIVAYVVSLILEIVSFVNTRFAVDTFIDDIVIEVVGIAFLTLVVIGLTTHRHQLTYLGGVIGMVALPVSIFTNIGGSIAYLEDAFKFNWAMALGSTLCWISVLDAFAAAIVAIYGLYAKKPNLGRTAHLIEYSASVIMCLAAIFYVVAGVIMKVDYFSFYIDALGDTAAYGAYSAVITLLFREEFKEVTAPAPKAE